MDGRKNNGGNKNAGRKPKAVEKTIKEYTEPHIAAAIEKIVEIMINGKRQVDQMAAAKILLEYNWGKPKQQTDITSNGETVNIPLSTWADDKE